MQIPFCCYTHCRCLRFRVCVGSIVVLKLIYRYPFSILAPYLNNGQICHSWKIMDYFRNVTAGMGPIGVMV